MIPFNTDRLPGFRVDDGYTTGMRDSMKDWTKISPPTQKRVCRRCCQEFMPDTHGQLYCQPCRQARKESRREKGRG